MRLAVFSSRSVKPLTALTGLAALVASAACGGGQESAHAPAPPVTSAQPPPASASADPLGPRPPIPAPDPYTPPVPVAYERPNGMQVWLLERHALPIVSIQIVLPTGSASDPDGKGGLAFATANMLDEGAGARGALDIARDVDRLGATLRTGATTDYAFVQLTVLKKNLAPAAAIFADVVTKPTFLPVEWKRVYDLWTNDLRQRQSEPNAVASVVTTRMMFGPTDPYGHPTDGTLKSVSGVRLEDVKRFYKDEWHPERATCVVVGDVTRAELDPLLDAALGSWARGKEAKVAAAQPSPGPARQVVVVDRPDAPQSVIAVAARGAAAGDPETPALVRVNAALGGSFTSRLNQDLREEHGWSYGAHSRFSFSKRPGLFVAQAAVQTDHTGDALKAMLADLDTYAKTGLTDEEIEKTRLIARGELVESFESVEAAARRLGRSAGIGLPPDHEAKASAKLYAAAKPELDALAAKYVRSSLIVVVGPRAKIEPQLRDIGITTLTSASPEGDVQGASK